MTFLLVGGFILLLAICAAIQLWYGTYRVKLREKFDAEGGDEAFGDSDRRNLPPW
jgi:hypothetical protein